MKKLTALALGAALITQLAACGTILHPERKGQTGGRLDAGVVILDGIGLLFFLIPGVIAFAVDFSNGTIYLPGGNVKLSPAETDSLVAKGEIDKAAVLALVSTRTGEKLSLDSVGAMEVRRL